MKNIRLGAAALNQVPFDWDGNLSRILAAIEAAKEALKGEDTGKQRETLDQLTKASHRLAELLYQQAQSKQTAPGGQAQSEPSQGAPEGGVVDAEFEDLGGKGDKK